MTAPFLMPPRPRAPDGSERRVGVELEFADLDAPSTAHLVRSLYGGDIQVVDPHRCKVIGTRLGDFTVELDMRSAHPEAKDGAEDPGLLDAVLEKLRPLWGRIGSLVMPFEVAAPPVPIARLNELDTLITGLRERGAAGTEASPLFAFGLHFNPQVAAEDADYIVDHLKAFLVLAPWLRSEIRIDATRRMTGFIAAFPVEYAVKVVDPAYRPDMDTLVADYLEHNPTRNRELDLFPLFAHLVPDSLFAKVADPHVRPRPTFHYRLPNARIGDPAWSLSQDWNRWVAVEELANDRARLDRLGSGYRDFAQRKALDDWASEAGKRLAENRLAG